MKTTALPSVFGFLCALATTVALEARQATKHVVGAAYSITNDPTGNYVLVHNIYNDGSVDWAPPVYTNGLGGVPAMVPAAGDALLSQGAVTVHKNYLFVVNPGNSSVTTFSIDPTNPANLTRLVGPEYAGGDFPVSIAASSQTDEVCVLSTGAKNAIQCFWPSEFGLRAIPDTWRPLGLNQTTPPHGPPNTASHIIFSDDGKTLFVSIKGAPPPGQKGYIEAWGVKDDGSLTTTSRNMTAPSMGLFPFGMVQIPNTSALLVADPALGATVYDYSDALLTSYRNIPLMNQSLNCWNEYSALTDTYWMSDTGSKNLYAVNLNHTSLNASAVQQFSITPYNPLDISIATVSGKDYLYVLSAPQNTINVVQLNAIPGNSDFMQNYNFTSFMSKANITWSGVNLSGMATWVKPTCQ